MPLQRSLSLRRRDGSWDRRWEETRRQETEERPQQSRPWVRVGKLNNSYWENRVRSEESAPARTPPPRRRLVTLTSPSPSRSDISLLTAQFLTTLAGGETPTSRP